MSSEPDDCHHGARLAPGIAAAAVLVAALWNASAALGPLDAGDLATAAVTLGVPHATGYPLEVMAGRVLAWLPLANLGARIAWTSAIASAVAAGLLVATVRRCSGAAAAWAVAGALFAAFLSATTLALHARIVEVYALQLALFSGVIYATARLRSSADLRWAAVGGLLIGLGVVNHALFRLLALPLAAGALIAAPVGTRWRVAALGVGSAAVAQLAWLYLPAAALGRSLHNWGDPSTPARLWDHMNGAYIRDAFSSDMGGSLALTGIRARELLDQLGDGLGPLLVPAFVAPLVLGRGTRWLAASLAGAAAIDAAYAVWINPMGLRDWQNGQILVACMAVLAGLTVAWLWSIATARRGLPQHATPVLCAITAALGLLAGPSAPADTANDRSIDDLIAIHAALAAPGSITTVASDGASSAALWNQLVLDARPDSVLIGRYLFGFPAQAVEHLDSAPFDALGALRSAPLPPREQGLAAFVRALLQTAGAERAVYWEVDATRSDLPAGTPFAHRWPLGRVNPPGELECSEAMRSFCGGTDALFAGAARHSAGADGIWYRRWLVTQFSWRGTRSFRAANFADAASWFERAAALDPNSSGTRTSLAAALASQGQLTEALVWIDEALLRDPASVVALRNGVQFAEAAGQPERAARYAGQLRRLGAAP